MRVMNVRVGRQGRIQNALRSHARVAVGDVLGDGAGKQKRVLGNQADLAAEAEFLDLLDIDVVDGDLPLLGVV